MGRLFEFKDRAKEQATRYPQEFEAFWAVARVGSKMEAYLAWKALGKDRPPLPELVASYQQQDDNRRALERAGEFAPRMKDTCRWLKYRCWENDRYQQGEETDRWV